MAPVSGGDCAPCPGMRLPLPNTLGLESGLKVMGAAGLAHFILSGSLGTCVLVFLKLIPQSVPTQPLPLPLMCHLLFLFFFHLLFLECPPRGKGLQCLPLSLEQVLGRLGHLQETLPPRGTALVSNPVFSDPLSQIRTDWMTSASLNGAIWP